MVGERTRDILWLSSKSKRLDMQKCLKIIIEFKRWILKEETIQRSFDDVGYENSDLVQM